MKTKFLIYISVFFIFAWPLFSRGQTIVTTAGSPSECPGDIVVPIDVTNCNGVGAISLTFYYNTSILTYVDYQNVDGELSSGTLVVNQTGEKVVIGWASTTAANVGDGTLLEIRFTGITGSSDITWDTQTPGKCEFSDLNGNVLSSSFNDGLATVYQSPLVLSPPEDVTALVGDNVSFSTNSVATGIEREWFVSVDDGQNWFSTGNTNITLQLYDVTLDMDGYLYRCEISGTCEPPAISDAAELAVIQPLTTSFETDDVCPGNITIPVLTSNFTDVASLSLAFEYSSTTLDYSGYQNVNALLPGNFVCNENNGTIYISWSGTTPVTFGLDTTLVELLFEGTTGSCSLNWDLLTPGNCEYTYLNAEEIVSVFENGSFTIYQVPEIQAEPIDQLIPENTSTSFGISAIASGITYQWQISINNGGTWEDLENNAIYGGVTSSSLSIHNASLGMSGNLYRCVVNGYCTPGATSNEVTLTVLPRITAIAGEVSSCPGPFTVPVDVTHFIDVASFSLTLSYDGSVAVFDGHQNLNSALSGGNFALNASNGKIYFTWTSTTPATIGDDLLLELNFTGISGNCPLNWNFNTEGACEFVDLDGNIIFDNYDHGEITIYEPPSILSHPESETIPEGLGATFTISAAGTGLSYQWQESTDNGNSWINLSNGSPYSGVHTAALEINPVNPAMDGNNYRCLVVGTCPPEVFSSTAELYVIPPVIYTSSGSVDNSCTGNITIPVNVSNCNNIGAISLVMNYDNTKMTFQGYDNLHTALGGGMFIFNDTGEQLVLSWASSSAISIGAGILIELKFTVSQGVNTNLVWDDQTPGNCEYSDPDGFIYVSSFASGAISTTSNALIVDAGEDKTIPSGGSVELDGTYTGGTNPFDILWTPSDGLSDPSIINPQANPVSTTEYKLTVTDNQGCSGSDEMMVEVLAPGIDLDLKVFLEGPYNTAGMNTDLNNNNLIPTTQPYSGSPWSYSGTENVASIPDNGVVDWILVEIRETTGDASSATQDKRLERKAGFLLSDGTVMSEDGSSMMHFDVSITDNLFVVIWHRNHIPVISSNPLTNAGIVYSWDFTNSANQAYGTDALKNLGSNIFGLYAGDGDGNGKVEVADKSGNWIPYAGKMDYLSGDYNMDSQVNNKDKNDFWYPNLNTSDFVPD